MDRDFRILFIGTSSVFATTSLQTINSEYHLAGIVESAPRGFINKWGFNRFFHFLRQSFNPHSLWHLSRKLKLPYFYYVKDDSRGLINFIDTTRPALGCVVSMNHLLPDEVLHKPEMGFINLHPSLLPDLRGPHVWTWLYYYNDIHGGVCVHRLDALEDHGDILKQADFPIFPGMPPDLLIQTASRLGAQLLLESIADIKNGCSSPFPQPAVAGLRRARRLNPTENLFLYRQWSLEHSFHFLQGSHPWYSPFTGSDNFWGLIDWLATSFQTESLPQHQLGLIRVDRNGFYFAHPQGKIRLRPKLNRLRVTLILLLLLAFINIVFSVIKISA